MDNQVNISAQSSVISQQSGIQSPLFSKEGLGEISAEELRKLIEGSRLSEENKEGMIKLLEFPIPGVHVLVNDLLERANKRLEQAEKDEAEQREKNTLLI